MSRFWHPFSPMGVTEHDELTIVRGEGSTLYTKDGRELIDAAGGLWYCSVGHGRTRIVDAMAAQARLIESTSCFDDVVNEPVGILADRVAALSPLENARVFFTSGGSDAVDTAAKLARRYWHEVGKPQKLTLLSREGSYHGAHTMGTSLAGIPANREGYGPLVTATERVPRFDAQALADTIDRLGADNVAAYFAEPVINAGVWAAPEGYFAEARRVCAERDVLFIADEVVTAYGRVGADFASARFDLNPDMILFAKGITSGYLPLGGVVVSERVAAPFFGRPDAPIFRHGYTYSGHATVCAAALANLDILAEEQIPQRVLQFEDTFKEILESLVGAPGVHAVRAKGLMAAVQIEPELVEKDPTLPRRIALAVRDEGVLSRMLSGFSLQVSPPLIITEDETQKVADAFRNGIKTAISA